MERFPRGTLPPKAFAAVATLGTTAVAKPAEALAEAAVDFTNESTFDGHARRAVDPARDLDLSTTCPNCSVEMLPEHAHYKCPACGYRDSSSF
jgi:Zn finger protein HypA/HybF involved in hydrogenase expression